MQKRLIGNRVLRVQSKIGNSAYGIDLVIEPAIANAWQLFNVATGLLPMHTP
jgi:hypothetical protein